MLKGHAKVELTNVNTGTTKTYEHDNLVTGIVASQISEMAKIANYDDVNKRYLPIYNKAMGGILLFASALEEKLSNSFLYPFSDITGYASNNVSPGTDVKRGSKNLTESGLSEDGKSYKFVWDFSTSQANGTISSLALTSSKCGALPYSIYDGSNYYDFRFVDVNFSSSIATETAQAIDFDFLTKIVTCARVINSTTVKISKYRIPIDEIRLNTSLMIPELVDEQIIDFSSSGITVNSNSNVVNTDDYYYILYAATSSESISAWRIDKSTMTIDENYGTSGKMDISLAIGEDDDEKVTYARIAINKTNRTTNNYQENIVIAYGDYILLVSPTNGYVSSWTSAPNGGTGTLNASLIYTKDNDTFLFNNRYIAKMPPMLGSDTVVRNSPRGGTLLNPASAGNGCYAAFMNSNGVIVEFTASGVQIGSTMDYRATINNLSTPVVKTAAQSMKITYTLSEA